MSDYGFAAPPPPPPPPPPNSSTPSSSLRAEVLRPQRHLRAAAGAAVAVVVAVAAAGGILAFRALHGSADGLVSMVPADTAVYVTVNFDPPGGQKLAVAGLLNKFPGLSDQSRTAAVNGWLDAAFAGSGLNHADVNGWLGSEVSIAMPASALSTLTPTVTSKPSPPSVAVLIASKDNAKAQAFLAKFRTGPVGSANKWTTTVYGGVTVTAGTRASGGGAYAITSNTVIVGSDAAAVDAVIDTAQGKRANLQSSGGYKLVDSQLPSDRLGLAYVDVASVVKQVVSSVASLPGGPAQLSPQAYGGLGVALVASSDGLALDGTENYDTSKLTPDERSLLAIAPHANGSIGFVPKTAYGLVAYSGLQQTLRSILTTVAPPGSAMDTTLQQFGVTDPAGIIGHLSGDGGIEVDKIAGQTAAAGALLFDTDSTAAAQRFLDRLMSSVCRQTGVCDLSQLTTQVDQGVTISSIPMAGSASIGVEPSWAVSNGWAIIGSSASEVRAVLDSRASGSGIDKSSGYQAAASHVAVSNNGLLYLDVPAIVSAIRNALPPAAQASFDGKVAPYLNPIGVVALSSQNASDHVTFSFFVQIR